MSSSERFILNALQTPEPMPVIYDAIERDHQTKEAIEDETGVGDTFDQARQGLGLLRMVGEEGNLQTSGFTWETGDRRIDFRLTALHNLNQECTGQDWGKQAAPQLIYQYLIEENIQYFKNNDEALYRKIENWYRDRGYNPKSSQGPIDLNDVKFNHWCRLASFLGLITKANGRDHTVRPDPRLVLGSIHLAADGDRHIEISEYMSWLQTNLLQVTLTSGNEIPEPLARVIYELVRDGQIKLVERGDAGAAGLERVPSHPNIDKQPNTIEVDA